MTIGIYQLCCGLDTLRNIFKIKFYYSELVMSSSEIQVFLKEKY